jgi:hypothetical protein
MARGTRSGDMTRGTWLGETREEKKVKGTRLEEQGRVNMARGVKQNRSELLGQGTKVRGIFKNRGTWTG